jgi:hypothetical protein
VSQRREEEKRKKYWVNHYPGKKSDQEGIASFNNKHKAPGRAFSLRRRFFGATDGRGPLGNGGGCDNGVDERTMDGECINPFGLRPPLLLLPLIDNDTEPLLFVPIIGDADGDAGIDIGRIGDVGIDEID